MEQWIEIRRRVLNGKLSKRAACAEYGIHWDTLTKILTHSDPAGLPVDEVSTVEARAVPASNPRDSGE